MKGKEGNEALEGAQGQGRLHERRSDGTRSGHGRQTTRRGSVSVLINSESRTKQTSIEGTQLSTLTWEEGGILKKAIRIKEKFESSVGIILPKIPKPREFANANISSLQIQRAVMIVTSG